MHQKKPIISTYQGVLNLAHTHTHHNLLEDTALQANIQCTLLCWFDAANAIVSQTPWTKYGALVMQFYLGSIVAKH